MFATVAHIIPSVEVAIQTVLLVSEPTATQNEPFHDMPRPPHDESLPNGLSVAAVHVSPSKLFAIVVDVPLVPTATQ